MILIFDTSGPVCSLSVIGLDGKVYQDLRSDKAMSHAEELPALAQYAIDLAGGLQQFKAIAVSKGPGSYTGLRIGTSLAKGLAYSAGLQLISACPLRAIAAAARLSSSSDYCIAIMDARRDEVYTRTYDSFLHPINEIHAHIVNEHSFGQIESSSIVISGNCTEKVRILLGNRSNVQYFETESFAANMADEVAMKFQNGIFESVAYYEPYYLKDFVAGVGAKK